MQESAEHARKAMEQGADATRQATADAEQAARNANS
jgi:hypothetical protein